MGEASGTYWGEEKCVQGFGGESRRKEQLGRTRHRWEDNIRMDHKVIGWKGVGLIYLAPLGVGTSDGPLWSRFP